MSHSNVVRDLKHMTLRQAISNGEPV